ncbi:MAG: hypothetical protein CVU90_00760 [Firmicutes bacterium HGW-Firmicutes-15]|nr:MAG: hypothetical protein CVU90_00760 [Firmicutes bacterium HGW-Firmicutes-15]
MKSTVLNYLIIGILSYYLIKGLLFLFMWQTLVKMEKTGKEKIAKRKQEREEAIKRRREIRENTKS